jgi:trehalose/maltose hydrolase-like predicted phosphorylase
MYPTVSLFWPQIAAALLQYRMDRTAGAAAKAASYEQGYKGLLYPWESAETGEETTPTWAATGVREIHIDGDISLAARQLWQLTHDRDWLSRALPMITGIADFWVSRTSPSTQGTDSLSINDVIPPDEYADHVNDSVYTNSVAKISLDFAIAALSTLGKPAPDIYSSVGSRLVVLLDQAKGVHPEYSGYSGGTIKQADAVLLGYPLGVDMPQNVRLNDLVYYSTRTDPNGPAMTYSMHSIAWLELGFPGNATEPFRRSYANVRQPFNAWTETPTGGAVNFITGAGGFLQAIWAGYSGIRITEAGVVVNPHLMPSPATSSRLRGLRFLGATLDVSHDPHAASVLLRNPPSAPVANLCLGPQPLVVGKEASFPLDSPVLISAC